MVKQARWERLLLQVNVFLQHQVCRQDADSFVIQKGKVVFVLVLSGGGGGGGAE